MTTPRVIKKYPNRRLYDCAESRYITLADVRDLVLLGTGFVVIDKKTDQEITRTILLQVIIEQEQHGEPIMTEDFLAQVIRAHGKPDGKTVPAFHRFAGARAGSPGAAAGHGREPGEDRKKTG